MMKYLICYKTKVGATEKYMNWLSKEIGADIKTFDEVSRGYDFSGYDVIIVSSGTYMGMMPLKRFLKRHWKVLQNKVVFAIAVGGVPATDAWSIRSYKSIPEKIREKITYHKIIGDTPESSRPADYKSPVKKDNLKEIVTEIKTVK